MEGASAHRYLPAYLFHITNEATDACLEEARYLQAPRCLPWGRDPGDAIQAMRCVLPTQQNKRGPSPAQPRAGSSKEVITSLLLF